MPDAQVYQKTPEDKAVILNVRAWEKQPFVAGSWMDLRVGFFLSLTSEGNNDDPAALAESISDPPVDLMDVQDRYWLGLIHGGTLPGFGSVFIGFTNIFGRIKGYGKTELISSDAGIGTTNTNFWRPRNPTHGTSVAIFDGDHSRANLGANLQQHFPQIPANTGGYAVMLGMQLLRDNPSSRTIKVNIKSSPNSADMFYSNTPTLDVLKEHLQTWPPSQQLGPVQLSAVPSAFYFYWPFRQSRLRIHSYGILKAK